MAKEKSLNPVAAHHKSEKRAALKKSKATVAAQRTERLSKRNPSRLEKQIAELKELDSAGKLRPKDKDTLKSLERDLALVRRARDKAGVSDDRPDSVREQQRRRREGLAEPDTGGGGKRRRVETEGSGSGSETDPEVRVIPMPRDTPPPVPRRRPKEEERKRGEKKGPVQITYSSAPVLRDLRKEATGAKFAPAAVRRNLDKVKGKGGLVEEEEWERLERAGYGGGKVNDQRAGGMKGDTGGEKAVVPGSRAVAMEEVEDEDL